MAPRERPRSDTLVMFGASGDLAKKKLFPAVYRLHGRGLLGVPVVGVALDDWSHADLVAHAEAAVKGDPDCEWDAASFASLADSMQYVAGDYANPDTFSAVKTAVGSAKHPIFHLAIPPSFFATVADGLAAAGLQKGARLIIEKPFGRDRESAQALQAELLRNFDENAIFRIDHFLGKEALRGLMVTRFANSFLEPLWSAEHLRCVMITMAEAFGVEDRGSFYDSVGALRDVLQNHLLQMVALMAMDEPADEGADALRDVKGEVLAAACEVDPANYVRGQYQGYLDVKGVAAGSDTETYGAFRLDIDSDRWRGVPFFLRAGKALHDTVTEMTVVFKPPERALFLNDGKPHPPNLIRIEAKPNSFAAVTWLEKTPGDQMAVDPITLAPPPERRRDIGPEPYELLIEEAMKGDATLFAREDSIDDSWRIVERILTDHAPCLPYDTGTWGPTEGRRLVADFTGWPEEPPA